MKRYLAFGAVALLACAAPAFALAKDHPGKTPRANQGQSGGKGAICHQTGSTKNPTVTIRVSMRAWTRSHSKHGDVMGACQNGRPRGFERLRATLSPTAAAATGSGAAVIDVKLAKHKALLCYTVNTTGVSATALTLNTLSALTVGGQTFAANAAVVSLKAPNARGVSHGCVRVSRELGQALLANPGGFAVTVNSSAFPSGQVAGTLTAT